MLYVGSIVKYRFARVALGMLPKVISVDSNIWLVQFYYLVLH